MAKQNQLKNSEDRRLKKIAEQLETRAAKQRAKRQEQRKHIYTPQGCTSNG